MSNPPLPPPSVTLSLTPEQHWTLHHVLLDRIDKESTEVTADVDLPPTEVFQAFETLDSGNTQFTLAQLEAIRDVLTMYQRSPTWWEVERPQLEQLLHRITQHIEQLQPTLGGT
ncbi:DUF7853 family protein [Halococcus salifodinae]|uniref:DUF7853 family protein n=1 Tax=Halococcus salifodinae TaxID=36738 RepID=UPI0009B5AC1A